MKGSGCGNLRLRSTFVPTLTTRQNAPGTVQPLLNAFSLPNGPDLGNGTVAFSAGYSDPSSLNSYGIRVDYLPWSKVTIFLEGTVTLRRVRPAGAERSSDQLQHGRPTKYRTQTLTVGPIRHYCAIDQRVSIQLQSEPSEKCR